MTVCARHRFSLELALWLQKATAKLLNDAFYAISCCEIKKLPWSDPGLYALVLHNWTLTSTIGAEVLKSRILASGGMPDSIILVRTVGVSAP